MMTVMAIIMGLLPIMWSQGAGADVMKRIAAPMIGGIVTSFVLELLIYPVIFEIWKGRELRKAAANGGNERMRMSMMKIGVVFILAVFCFADPGWTQHQHGSHPPPAPARAGRKKAEPSTGYEASSSRIFLLDGTDQGVFRDHAHGRPQEDAPGDEDESRGGSAGHAQYRRHLDGYAGSNLPLNEAVVKMKVISPGGKEEVKMLDQIPAMNQYSGDFALPEKGRYQILILFKAEGKKQAGGFYYRVN